MKLLRYGPAGQEKPGILAPDGTIRDLSKVVPDLSGKFLSPDSLKAIAQLDVKGLPVVEGNPRFGSCVAQPGKFLCEILAIVLDCCGTGITARVEGPPMRLDLAVGRDLA